MLGTIGSHMGYWPAGVSGPLRSRSRRRGFLLTRYICLGIYPHVPDSPEPVPRKTAALGSFVEKGLPEFSGRGAGRNGLCARTGSTWRQASERQALERGGAGILEIVEDFRGDTYARSMRCALPRWCTCCTLFRRIETRHQDAANRREVDCRTAQTRQADYESRGKP